MRERDGVNIRRILRSLIWVRSRNLNVVGRTDWRAIFRARAYLFFAFRVWAALGTIRRVDSLDQELVDGNWGDGSREGE